MSARLHKERLPRCAQIPRPREDGVEHRRCEDAGEGVLLGGMVAAQEGHGVLTTTFASSSSSSREA
jgi:hypothetical protein